jgi:predicted acetyltransferase
MALTLRPFTVADETEALAAHAELALDGFEFLLETEQARPWPAYVARLAEVARGENLAPDRVRATLLVAEVDGQVVGRSSIRFALNSWLENFGGHIGYGVRPAFRRRGYATGILRQSLAFCASEGLDRVLVTCDDDNVASSRTIENCGGVLDDRRTKPTGEVVRRYWVPTA